MERSHLTKVYSRTHLKQPPSHICVTLGRPHVNTGRFHHRLNSQVNTHWSPPVLSTTCHARPIILPQNVIAFRQVLLLYIVTKQHPHNHTAWESCLNREQITMAIKKIPCSFVYTHTARGHNQGSHHDLPYILAYKAISHIRWPP